MAIRGNAADIEAQRKASREKNRAYRERNREAIRVRQRAWDRAHKEQIAANLQRWRKNNPEKYRAQSRRQRAKNIEKVRARNRLFMKRWYQENKEAFNMGNWRSYLRRKYGLTPEQLEAMKEAQGHRCLICNQRRKLVVDHDHVTNRVRGLLCNACNCGIGHFCDDADLLRVAITYLTVPVRRVAIGGH